jgi:hypothetical protein
VKQLQEEDAQYKRAVIKEKNKKRKNTLMRVLNSQRKLDQLQFESFKHDRSNYKDKLKQHDQSILNMRKDLSEVYNNQHREHEKY